MAGLQFVAARRGGFERMGQHLRVTRRCADDGGMLDG
jgi:hypothetical protein